MCSILNLVVLFSLSLGASHSTMICLCYDPVVAQSGSEYHQPVSKISGELLAAGREKEGDLATTCMSLEFEFHVQFPCGSL